MTSKEILKYIRDKWLKKTFTAYGHAYTIEEAYLGAINNKNSFGDYSFQVVCLLRLDAPFMPKNTKEVLVDEIARLQRLKISELLNVNCLFWCYTDRERFESKKNRLAPLQLEETYSRNSLIRHLLREAALMENKEDILIQKIGLQPEVAAAIVERFGKLAIWFANAWVNSISETLSMSKQEAAQRISMGSLAHQRTRQQTILDWLRHPLTPPQNLKTLTYPEANQKAQQFHEALKAMGGDIDYTEVDEIEKQYPPTAEGVRFYWAYIPSSYCDKESQRMGHCGRTGYSNVLFSLRSVRPYGKGHTHTDSHVTIAYGQKDGKIYQCKGKKNGKPKAEYFPYIFDFIKMMLEDKGEEYVHPFSGFASEYAASQDYGWKDMTDSELEDLYQLKPELFTAFFPQRLLMSRGIIPDNPISLTFDLKLNADDIEDSYVTNRDYREGTIERYLSGDMYNDFDSYDSSAWADYIDDLNTENEKRVLALCSKMTGVSPEDIEEEGIKDFISENEDDLEDVVNLMNSVIEDGIRDDYHREVIKCIKAALEAYGTITEFNYDTVTLTIDLQTLIDKNEIDEATVGEYMDACSSHSDFAKCVFMELLCEGLIEKPKLDLDDRYDPYCSRSSFNEGMHDRLGELED